jgi:RNA polymerase sigma-B factor
MPPRPQRTSLAGAGDDRQLMRRYRGGEARARATLIERYLPLSRSLALRYRDKGEPLDDLIQVANLGLVKAVDRWEPERGLAFSTFAVPTILGELRRYFRDATWMVRPPRDLVELALSIERVRQPLNAALGRDPAPSDFAEYLGRSLEHVTQALETSHFRRMTSLDTEVHDGSSDSETVGDRLGCEDHGFERAEARATFESLIAALDQRAREVLRLRFADDLLQGQIADRLGCSQMNVSRIIRAALELLAAPAV